MSCETRLPLRDGTELVISQEIMNIHYENDVDKNWTFTDTMGHSHWYDGGYPTLTAVYEDYPCTAHGEDEGYYPFVCWICKHCSEMIEPGTTGPGVIAMLGKRSARREGWLRGITATKAQEMLNDGTGVAVMAGIGNGVSVRIEQHLTPEEFRELMLNEGWMN